VISNGLWRSRYGGDPGLIGKSVDLGGAPYEVIGVLGPDFHWDRPVDIWLPLQANPNSMNHLHNFFAAARLVPGVSLEQAGAAVKVASEGFRKRFPPEQSFFGRGLAIEPMQEVIVRDIRPALRLLLGTVSLVLLIACANVANLLLARASVRRREIAIRSAMGAGRLQIIRQLLTESAVLSLAGGVLGLLLGYFGLRALLLMKPGNIPRIGDRGAAVAMDWHVLLFTVLVTALAGIFFGLIPAIRASRTDLTITLKEGDTRLGGAVRRNRVRWTLVAAEVALAVVLLVGSALMMRTYVALRAVKPGFDASGVLTMDMSLDGPRFQKTAAVAELMRNGTKAVESLAGVEAAATTSSLPLEPGYYQTFTIEGRPLAENPYHGFAFWIFISPHYFDVFHIPVVQGRAFTDHDDASGALVVAINEAMARQFWPNRTAVGERISLGKGLGANFEESPREIVGVVGDVRDEGLNSTPGPTMYVPVAQLSDTSTALNSRTYPLMWIARTRAAPFSLSANLQGKLRRASGGLPVGHVRSMQQVVLESIARNDFNATLFAIFAGMALLLAAIGIYGLVGYSVQQRTHEIGIRMALGAQSGDVLRMVAGSGMKLVLIGLGCGIAGALALTRLLSSLLFGVRPTDPRTFVAVAFGLLSVGALACYIPARRATKVGPMVALRHE
jgi:predicted permease